MSGAVAGDKSYSNGKMVMCVCDGGKVQVDLVGWGEDSKLVRPRKEQLARFIGGEGRSVPAQPPHRSPARIMPGAGGRASWQWPESSRNLRIASFAGRNWEA